MSQRIEEIEINFDMTTKTLRHSSNKPTTEEHIKKFISDYEALSYKELGEIYGAAPRTLRDWANYFGAKRIKTNSCVIPNSSSFCPEATYDELIAYYKEHNKLISKLENRQQGNIVSAEVLTDTPIALVCMADAHLGSSGVDVDAFDTDIKMIRDTEKLYCIVGGDMTENIIEPSKIGSGLNQLPIISQKSLLYSILKMLQPKLVALGTGNHSYWSALATGEDELAKLAKELRIVYTSHGGLLNLTVGNVLYKIFRTHKSKFNSSVNPNHSMKQTWRMGEFNYDIGISEHLHLASIEPWYGHGEEKWACRVGSYKTYDDYALRNGFFGVRPANPTFILYPDKKRVVGFLHMQEAIEFLGKV